MLFDRIKYNFLMLQISMYMKIRLKNWHKGEFIVVSRHVSVMKDFVKYYRTNKSSPVSWNVIRAQKNP